MNSRQQIKSYHEKGETLWENTISRSPLPLRPLHSAVNRDTLCATRKREYPTIKRKSVVIGRGLDHHERLWIAFTVDGKVRPENGGYAFMDFLRRMRLFQLDLLFGPSVFVGDHEAIVLLLMKRYLKGCLLAVTSVPSWITLPHQVVFAPVIYVDVSVRKRKD